jgi:hypothetical protein
VRLRSSHRNACLTRLLAALLLLQWSTAFEHCLRLAGAPARTLTVEICTASGLHSVDLPSEDRGGDRLSAGLICPACQGPASLALPPPVMALAAPISVALDAGRAPAFHAPPRAPRQHGQPRAPPAA